MNKMQELIDALLAFDKNPEVQALYAKRVKYVTDDDVRAKISAELDRELTILLELIAEVLVDFNTGAANKEAWAKLKDAGRPREIWLRHGGEDMGVIALNSISIAFDCMP